MQNERINKAVNFIELAYMAMNIADIYERQAIKLMNAEMPNVKHADKMQLKQHINTLQQLIKRAEIKAESVDSKFYEVNSNSYDIIRDNSYTIARLIMLYFTRALNKDDVANAIADFMAKYESNEFFTTEEITKIKML